MPEQTKRPAPGSRLAAGALVAALLLGVPATASAAASQVAQGPPTVAVNGELLDLSEIRIASGVLFAPFDELVEAFAGRYYFDPASRTGRGFLSQPAAVVTARAGQPGLDIDGRRVDAPAALMTDQLLVPVAALFRGLGGQVTWDAQLRRAVVRWSAAQVVAEPEARNAATGQSTAAGTTAVQSSPVQSASALILPDVDARQLDLLVHVVNAEAYGAPTETQVAVAAVIVNRVRAGWGRSLADVLLAPGQFTVVRTGAYLRTPLMPSVREAVLRALRGEDPTGGALYFTDLASVPAAWKNPARYTLTLQSGGMVFYRPR
ncbi:MAG: cell wall hydrolase [Bacillota bacterium]|nr:cell wall hydrolase [Bacillota bacterium]